MKCPVDKLVLERVGPAEATVGMVSLPLPREVASTLRLNHPHSAMQGVAWWERHKVPRRSLAFVIDDKGVPGTLKATTAKRAGGKRPGKAKPVSPWQVKTRITKEKLDYTPHKFSDIASLRGVPAGECTTVEYELELGYGGRSLVLQMGATEKDGKTGPHYWQNVQIDRLWSNEVVEAVRVGGIIYNGDSYLWGDLYLLLFANGVAHAAQHFVTTLLHPESYDFQGLPVIRMGGGNLKPVNATLPVDGNRFELGDVTLNLADALTLCSAEHPAKLEAVNGSQFYWPFDRVFNPQKADCGPLEWAPGTARTVRFQFSLSDAEPVIARYRAPAWWYTLAGEPWPGGFLPVRGRYSVVSDMKTDEIRTKLMTRGRFDACSAEMGNDGFIGSGMMRNYYLTGSPEIFKDALDYCYFWADWAVDHRDFSVHQWIGGWGWKTCAYTKFRDLLMGYLETGDPYLQDGVEMVAERYWTWFRANWPRCTIGRDSFEVSGWAWLWRFFRTEHARERTRELARMLKLVLEERGVIGGQMGAGPHPGYLSSLYMSGVCMISLLEVAEAEQEEGNTSAIQEIVGLLHRVHVQFNRSDVELFPSSYNPEKKDWHAYRGTTWACLAVRIYPEMIRLQGHTDDATLLGLSRCVSPELPPIGEFTSNRAGDGLLQPVFYDPLVLGCRLAGKGVSLEPMGTPEHWASAWSVSTPFGELKITVERQAGQVRLIFGATKRFPVTVRWAGKTIRSTSKGNAAFVL